MGSYTNNSITGLSLPSPREHANLICPRPLLVQTGKKEGIAWWPQVIEEFEASKEHHRKLGIEERIAMHGGHEIRVESGVEWMRRWLQ